jgi:hypothetical protein
VTGCAARELEETWSEPTMNDRIDEARLFGDEQVPSEHKRAR